MSYLIINKRSKKPVKGTRVYPTERGAKLGLTAATDRYVQRIYLKSGYDYSAYCRWSLCRNEKGFKHTPATLKVQEVAEDFRKRHQIVPAKVSW